MRASEFITTYSVNVDLVHLADLDEPSTGRQTRAWTYVARYFDGTSDRVLAVNYYSGSQETAETADLAETFAQLSRDSRQDGQYSFDEYLSNYYDKENPRPPAHYYRSWVEMVWLRHRIEEWLTGHPEMLRDFDTVEEE